MRCAIILAVLILFPAVGLCQDPAVDIKCNGLDSGILIPSGGNVKLSFEITAGTGLGYPVDVWVVLKTPLGFFSYDGSGPYWGWNYGVGNAYFTGPLADMKDMAVDRPLPDSPYRGHVALDVWADGILDLQVILASDHVDFVIDHSAMAYIPAGEYAMGDHHDGEPDAPVHAVYIDAFYMDVFETTNRQYCAYLNSAYAQGLIEVRSGLVYKNGGSEKYCDTYSSDPHSRIHWNGAVFIAGKYKHPMVTVSWYGAAAYANWRSAQEGLTPCYDLNTWDCAFGAGGYRLPTEAEWEKAARGGEETPYFRYPWGDSLDGSKANYMNSGDLYDNGTSPGGYYDGNQTPAGSDMANGYGLYDMAGNVWEWCNDWYTSDYYLLSPYNNPTGPASNVWRVLRGGSWFSNYSRFLRCAYRHHNNPGRRNKHEGFRLALD